MGLEKGGLIAQICNEAEAKPGCSGFEPAVHFLFENSRTQVFVGSAAAAIASGLAALSLPSGLTAGNQGNRIEYSRKTPGVNFLQ